MATIHLLSHELSKESAKELEDLKLRLADSRGALKKALEVKFSLTDQVTRLKVELSAFESDIS